MKKIDLYLTDVEREKLGALAKSRGKTMQDCLREMIAASHVPGWVPETSRPRSAPPPAARQSDKPTPRPKFPLGLERAPAVLKAAGEARGAAVSRANGARK